MSYFAIGNDELRRLPVRMKVGDKITCPKCGGQHELRESKGTPRGPSLLFYTCDDDAFLAAVDGKDVMKPKPPARWK